MILAASTVTPVLGWTFCLICLVAIVIIATRGLSHSFSYTKPKLVWKAMIGEMSWELQALDYRGRGPAVERVEYCALADDVYVVYYWRYGLSGAVTSRIVVGDDGGFLLTSSQALNLARQCQHRSKQVPWLLACSVEVPATMLDNVPNAHYYNSVLLIEHPKGIRLAVYQLKPDVENSPKWLMVISGPSCPPFYAQATDNSQLNYRSTHALRALVDGKSLGEDIWKPRDRP